MEAGYLISNRGADNPNYIIIYNWLYSNEVDNVRYSLLENNIIGEKNIVAIFKIKYK